MGEMGEILFGLEAPHSDPEAGFSHMGSQENRHVVS